MTDHIHYFTCVHCGGLTKQTHRDIDNGPGYVNGQVVISNERLIQTRETCYHQGYDESGVNFREVPESEAAQMLDGLPKPS